MLFVSSQIFVIFGCLDDACNMLSLKSKFYFSSTVS